MSQSIFLVLLDSTSQLSLTPESEKMQRVFIPSTLLRTIQKTQKHRKKLTMHCWVVFALSRAFTMRKIRTLKSTVAAGLFSFLHLS